MNQIQWREFKMNFKRISTLLLIVLLLISISISSIMAQSIADREKRKELLLGIGSQAGAYYYMAMVLQPILESHDYIVGTRPGGDFSNIQGLQNGELDFGWAVSYSPELAMQGELFQTPGVKYDKLRFVASFYDTYLHFMVRADSDIETLADLEGKRIGVGTQQQQQTYTFPIILDYYDLSYEKIEEAGGTIAYVGNQDGVQMLQDGTLDFYLLIAGYPSALPMAADQAIGIKLISLSDEIADAINNEVASLQKTIIPKGTYSGVTEDVIALKSPYILMTNEDVSEDIVYKMCAAIYDDKSIWDDVVKGYPTGINIDRALEAYVIPMHPGAEKYYREKGLID